MHKTRQKRKIKSINEGVKSCHGQNTIAHSMNVSICHCPSCITRCILGIGNNSAYRKKHYATEAWWKHWNLKRSVLCSPLLVLLIHRLNGLWCAHIGNSERWNFKKLKVKATKIAFVANDKRTNHASSTASACIKCDRTRCIERTMKKTEMNECMPLKILCGNTFLCVLLRSTATTEYRKANPTNVVLEIFVHSFRTSTHFPIGQWFCNI